MKVLTIVKHTVYQDSHGLAFTEKVYILSFHGIDPKLPCVSNWSTDLNKQKVNNWL